MEISRANCDQDRNSTIEIFLALWEPRAFCQKVALENFEKSTDKNLLRSLFLTVFNCRPAACISLKKKYTRRCFPVTYAKLLRIPFLVKNLRVIV